MLYLNPNAFIALNILKDVPWEWLVISVDNNRDKHLDIQSIDYNLKLG